MAGKKKKNPTMVTPVGALVYPHLNQPDMKFAKDGERGNYHVTVRWQKDAPGVQEFVNKVKAAHEEAGVVAKERHAEHQRKTGKKSKFVFRDLPIRNTTEMVEGEEEPQETGEIEMTFKMKAYVKPTDREGWWQEPALFDSKKNNLGKVAKAPKIGMGSTGRVTFEYFPYWQAGDVGGGLSLRLLGVQLFKFVEFVPGAKSADSLGFNSEADGYDGDADEAFVFDATKVAASEGGEEAEGGEGGDDDFE